MTDPTDTIRAFYAALARGDAPAALGLMAEWRPFALTPESYITEGGTVVSLGAFTGVHGTTGKTAIAPNAHVWDVAEGKIRRFRQFIDTLAIAEARR